MHIVAFSSGSALEDDSARFATLILDELKKQHHTTELVLVGATPPLFCTDCKQCSQTGTCVLNDQVNDWKQKIEQADAFFITGHIRNSGLVSTMVTFLERLERMGKANPDFLRGKFGGLGITGDRDGGMKAIFDIVSFFQNTNATLVWACYWPFTWNIGDGGRFEDNDPEGTHLAIDLGQQMAWVLEQKALYEKQ